MDKKLRIVHVPLEQAPEVKIIGNKLGDMQKLVGGYIETVRIMADDSFIFYAIVNEEGKVRLPQLPDNRYVNNQWLAGDFFITKSGKFGGEFISLTKFEAEALRAAFEKKVVITA